MMRRERPEEEHRTNLWQASLLVQWTCLCCYMLHAHRNALHSKALQGTANLHQANLAHLSLYTQQLMRIIQIQA